MSGLQDQGIKLYYKGSSFKYLIFNKAYYWYHNENEREVKDRCYLANGDKGVFDGLTSDSCKNE